jgi:hypothetical protein
MNILDKIIKINVSTARQIPASVKSTPTLIVKGRPPIVGQSIEFFFNSYTAPSSSNNSNIQTNNVQSNNVQSNNNQSNNKSNSGIQDFNVCEMGSCWSDAYSFLGTDTPINHSYSFLGGTNVVPNTKATSKVRNNSRKNKKMDEMQQRLEAFKASRDADISRGRPRGRPF